MKAKTLPKQMEIDGMSLVPKDADKITDKGYFNGLICRVRCYLGKVQQETTGKETTADNCKYRHLCFGSCNVYKKSLYFIKKKNSTNQ